MEEHTILLNLPTSVRGMVYHDDNGDPVIVLNARLTREANRRTYKHEHDHIKRGEMYDESYNEYGGLNK